MPAKPTRLHHSAVVAKDLGESKKFYENIVGLPLTATWCESSEQLGDFCHAFFGLEDDSCVALFQFADPNVYERLKKPETLSPFHHLALAGTSDMQQAIREKADAAGLNHYTTDHGYCVSLYLRDPDDHVVEVTYDTDIAIQSQDNIRQRAAGELERWLAGDHSTNNDIRGNESTVTG